MKIKKTLVYIKVRKETQATIEEFDHAWNIQERSGTTGATISNLVILCCHIINSRRKAQTNRNE